MNRYRPVAHIADGDATIPTGSDIHMIIARRGHSHQSQGWNRGERCRVDSDAIGDSHGGAQVAGIKQPADGLLGRRVGIFVPQMWERGSAQGYTNGLAIEKDNPLLHGGDSPLWRA